MGAVPNLYNESRTVLLVTIYGATLQIIRPEVCELGCMGPHEALRVQGPKIMGS